MKQARKPLPARRAVLSAVRGHTASRDRELLKRLKVSYPDPRSELNFDGGYQLLVAVILSAQCTDKKVNEVTPLLFAAYPNFQALAKAPSRALEKIIRPINYYRTKALHLVRMARRISEEFNGVIPCTHEALQTLPGVGRKTANVVLGELGICPTLPVDTHVGRVSRRLGLTTAVDPAAVEQDLTAHFAPRYWRTLHHWLIFHGRRVCKAQHPLCPECVLRDLCPSADCLD